MTQYEERGRGKKLWRTGIRRKMLRTVKKMTERANGAVMLDAEISRYFDILRNCTKMYGITHFMFNVNMNVLMRAITEAAKQGFTVRMI